jgi:hypothetical protein
MGSVMKADIVSHLADEQDVVRVDGPANRTIAVSIDGLREGLNLRGQLSAV